MSFLAALFSIFALFSARAHAVPAKRAISTTVYGDLLYHYQYASSAYVNGTCAKPNNKTLIGNIFHNATDTHGYVARDDKRQEIVVVFRGSTSNANLATDLGMAKSLAVPSANARTDFFLVPFVSPGVHIPNANVSNGYLTAYNAVASQVSQLLKPQMAKYPAYKLVTAGHSLGGALASIAGVSLRQNFPAKSIRMYTYGQPRTGNPTFAKYVNANFGKNAFRVTHRRDGVPALPPTYFGFQHHGIEYWLNPDPSSPANTTMCAASGEDPKCSASISEGWVVADHLKYFNIAAGTSFCG